MAKTPAKAPTAIAFRSLATFSVTSALASSISSCTSNETRSEISWTVSARSCAGLSVAKAAQDHGHQDAAGERGADDDLGTLGRELHDGLGPRRRRARRRVSGGV